MVENNLSVRVVFYHKFHGNCGISYEIDLAQQGNNKENNNYGRTVLRAASGRVNGWLTPCTHVADPRDPSVSFSDYMPSQS